MQRLQYSDAKHSQVKKSSSVEVRYLATANPAELPIAIGMDLP